MPHLLHALQMLFRTPREHRRRHRNPKGTGMTLSSQQRLFRMQRRVEEDHTAYPSQRHRAGALLPPRPPLLLTPALALDPAVSQETLWTIAAEKPELRHWLIANPAASPELLEFVAQKGGPGVREGFDVLFDDSG